MKRAGLSVGGLAVAALGLLVALASRDPSAQLAAGGLAVIAAGLVGVLWMTGEVEAVPPSAPPAGPDPIGGLQGAFVRQSLGREQVIFAVRALELASGRSEGPSLTPDRVRHLLGLTPNAFRAWLEGRLDALERET